MFFIKSGTFKVVRLVDFIKQKAFGKGNPTDPNAKEPKAEELYKTPQQEHYEQGLVTQILLEICSLQRYHSFGDYQLWDQGLVFQPNTVVSATLSEIYFIE